MQARPLLTAIPTGSGADRQAQGEIPGAVSPPRLDCRPGPASSASTRGSSELGADLGPDGLARRVDLDFEAESPSRCAASARLRRCISIHSCSASQRARWSQRREVEVGAEVAVDDVEDVAVERRRDPGRVVVGGDQPGPVLDQVGARAAAGRPASRPAPRSSRSAVRARRVEVADGAAEEGDEAPPAARAAWSGGARSRRRRRARRVPGRRRSRPSPAWRSDALADVERDEPAQPLGGQRVEEDRGSWWTCPSRTRRACRRRPDGRCPGAWVRGSRARIGSGSTRAGR